MNEDVIMHEKIIFFDGVCNLCNGFINFVFQYNDNSTLKVASLQGETAKKHLTQADINNLSSVIYLRNGKKYYQSSAVLYVLKDMGGIFQIFFPLIILPSFFRDVCYDLIAKNRYRLFGKKDHCRLPTPDERERFLP